MRKLIALLVGLMLLTGAEFVDKVPAKPARAELVGMGFADCGPFMLVISAYDYDGQLDFIERYEYYLMDETLVAVALYMPVNGELIAVFVAHPDGRIIRYTAEEALKRSGPCEPAAAILKKRQGTS